MQRSLLDMPIDLNHHKYINGASFKFKMVFRNPLQLFHKVTHMS